MSVNNSCHWMQAVVFETIFKGYMYDKKTNNIYAPCSNTVVGKSINGKIIWNKKVRKHFLK